MKLNLIKSSRHSISQVKTLNKMILVRDTSLRLRMPRGQAELHHEANTVGDGRDRMSFRVLASALHQLSVTGHFCMTQSKQWRL